MTEFLEAIGIDANTREKFLKEAKFLKTKALPDDLSILDKNKSPFTYRCINLSYFLFVVNRHFSMKGFESVNLETSDCIKKALDYFDGSWAMSSKHPDAPSCLRKASENLDLRWSEIFSRAFLVAVLSGDKKAIKSLASWPDDPSLPADPGDRDPGFAKILISMASHFSEKPIRGLDAMEKSIAAGRGKGPKLLLLALNCAREKDQKGFEKHFKESVSHFAKTIGQIFNVGSLVFIEGSLLLATARHLGISMPVLETKLQARILTPETTDLHPSARK